MSLFYIYLHTSGSIIHLQQKQNRRSSLTESVRFDLLTVEQLNTILGLKVKLGDLKQSVGLDCFKQILVATFIGL